MSNSFVPLLLPAVKLLPIKNNHKLSGRGCTLLGVLTRSLFFVLFLGQLIFVCKINVVTEVLEVKFDGFEQMRGGAG